MDDDNTAPPIDDVAPSNAAVPAIVDYDYINTDLAYYILLKALLLVLLLSTKNF